MAYVAQPSYIHTWYVWNSRQERAKYDAYDADDT